MKSRKFDNKYFIALALKFIGGEEREEQWKAIFLMVQGTLKSFAKTVEFSVTLHQTVWLSREMARPLNSFCGSSSLTSAQDSLITMIPNRRAGDVFRT